ncbi:MAG: hypothetical protein AAF432_01545 [Planctomycetota bacterium]
MNTRQNTMTRFRRRTGFLVAGAASGLLLASPALAQSQSWSVDRRIDDGTGEEVTYSSYYSMPDFTELRTPDFLRSDLPTFEKSLQLSAPQVTAVGHVLDQYLLDFDAMVRKHLSDMPKVPGMYFANDDMGALDPDAPEANNFAFGEPGEDGQGNLGAIIDSIVSEAGGGDVDIDAGPTEVGVVMTIGAFGPEGEGGGAVEVGPGGAVIAEPGVMIAVDGGGDFEMTEEMQKALQEAAQQMAEDLQRQLEEGDSEMAFVVGGGPPVDIEEHERRMVEIEKRSEALKSDKAALRDEFVRNVQALLAENQLERWPSLERVLTRKKTLPDSRLDGENVDLIALVEDMKLPASQLDQLEEHLMAYELALDDVLRRRNAFLSEAQQQVDEYLQTSAYDDALEVVDRATRLRLAVRDTTRTHAQIIAQSMDADAASEFETLIDRQTYPRLHRRGIAERSFDRALELDGLDDETMANMLALREAFDVDCATIDGEIRRAILEHQPRESRRMIESMAAASSPDGDQMFEFFPGSRDGDPIREAYARRRALEQRHVETLHSMLTPDQVAELPKIPTERSGPIIFSTGSTPMNVEIINGGEN